MDNKPEIYTLRVSARTPDRKKVACLNKISSEMLVWNGSVPIGFIEDLQGHLSREVHRNLEKFAGTTVTVESVKLAEQLKVQSTLTQEDFDDYPEWAEGGFKVGDTYTDYVTVDVFELDKNVLAKPQDIV
jgi:hypothetical protein